jgi:hypothetical protein
MIDQINKLIAVNLKLFYLKEDNFILLKDFIDTDGKPIIGAKILADIMHQKELIVPKTKEADGYVLTEFGKSICLHGGWEVHLRKLNKIDQNAMENEEVEVVHQKNEIKKGMIILAVALTLIALALFYGL